MTQPLFQAGITAPAVNLSISGESSTDGVASMVIGIFLAKSAGKFRSLRPWADEAHVTAKDIPKLRKLIKAGTPKIITNSGAARVGRHRPDRSKIAFRMFVHCSELDHREPASAETNPGLTVKNGAAIHHPYRQCNECEQWREQNQRGNRTSYIDETFEKAGKAPDRLMLAGARRSALPVSFRSAD